jgi:electron transfer flavoprotein alpha/beta subunit
MKAKKKPIQSLSMAELGQEATEAVKTVKVTTPAAALQLPSHQHRAHDT